MRELLGLMREDACHSEHLDALSSRGRRSLRAEGPMPIAPGLHRSFGAKSAPQDDRGFRVLLRLRHLYPAGVDLHVALNLHLERCADWEFHFRTMLQ
jgi:hypothetical protein